VLARQRRPRVLLFTTLRALRRAHDALRGTRRISLARSGAPARRSELLERFRSLGNAVLLGSQSFWRAWTCVARPSR